MILSKAVTAAQKQVLEEAVAEGQISQEQTGRMQKRLEACVGFGGPGLGHGAGKSGHDAGQGLSEEYRATPG